MQRLPRYRTIHSPVFGPKIGPSAPASPAPQSNPAVSCHLGALLGHAEAETPVLLCRSYPQLPQPNQPPRAEDDHEGHHCGDLHRVVRLRAGEQVLRRHRRPVRARAALFAQAVAAVSVAHLILLAGTASSQRSPSRRIERIHCRVLCRSVRRSPDAHSARARRSMRVFTLLAPQNASRGKCRTGHASPGGSRRCQCSGRTAPAASARLRPSSGYRPRRC
jgi:hypothetical protein